MTKKELKIALNKIGWDIKGSWPNEKIYDYENKSKDIRIYSDRIEISQEHFSNCFHFVGCELYELKNSKGKVDCVGIMAIGNKNVFIQFYNHNI